jgi:23S rRNA (guanosine2251-2'-O)-methyltransferase
MMKPYRQKQFQRPKKNTLVIGPQAVAEAIKTGVQLERIFVLATAHGAAIENIKNIAFGAGVPVNKVPVEKLNSFNAGDHSGCIAVLSKVQYQDLQDIISFTVENGETPLFLILDGITDVRNIGGIARTAYCCGVHALIIPEKGVGALNEDAVLTSAGALEKLPVCRVYSLLSAVETLHLNGIKVLASEMKAEKKIFDIDMKEPIAFVMGSEDKGVFHALAASCDYSFCIPMPGDFESLNVSVATGIILYEAVRQKMVG